MNRHWPGLIVPAVAATLVAACSVNVDEHYFFHPGPATAGAPTTVTGVAVERLTIAAADGTSLGGVRISQADANLEILYFGGNASRADEMVVFLGPIIRGTRANLTMIDYRGYGRSGGTPTIATVKADALKSFDYVRDRERSRPIVVHGMSLGGFAAAYVAANRTANGLVLEATAPDAETWARDQVPFIAKPIVRLHIAPAVLAENNIERVKRHTGPLLVMTGSKDSVTPPDFMKPILAASPSSTKRSVVAKGARHGHALLVPEARQAYIEFLESVR